MWEQEAVLCTLCCGVLSAVVKTYTNCSPKTRSPVLYLRVDLGKLLPRQGLSDLRLCGALWLILNNGIWSWSDVCPFQPNMVNTDALSPPSVSPFSTWTARTVKSQRMRVWKRKAEGACFPFGHCNVHGCLTIAGVTSPNNKSDFHFILIDTEYSRRRTQTVLYRKPGCDVGKNCSVDKLTVGRPLGMPPPVLAEGECAAREPA